MTNFHSHATGSHRPLGQAPRSNMSPDLAIVLDAIGRLEQALGRMANASPPPPPQDLQLIEWRLERLEATVEDILLRQQATQDRTATDRLDLTAARLEDKVATAQARANLFWGVIVMLLGSGLVWRNWGG